MSTENLIEGIGDEVTYTFALLFTLLGIIFSWWSTQVEINVSSTSATRPSPVVSSPEQSEQSGPGVGEENQAVDVVPDEASEDPVQENVEADASGDHQTASSSTNHITEEMASDNASGDNSERYTVRIKYLDETEGEATAVVGENVETFRRRCFSENRPHKMIFRGRVLQDGNTLESYGVIPIRNDSGEMEEPVIHSFPAPPEPNTEVTSTTNHQSNHSESAEVEMPLNVSQFFLPIFGMFLCVPELFKL